MASYLNSMVRGISSALDINQATLSGSCDIIVVEHEDGHLSCSPFHLRFGKLQVMRSYEKTVTLTINGVVNPHHMKLGRAGEAFFVLETDDDDIRDEFLTSPIAGPAIASPVIDASPLVLNEYARTAPNSPIGNKMGGRSAAKEHTMQTLNEDGKVLMPLPRSRANSVALPFSSSERNSADNLLPLSLDDARLDIQSEKSSFDKVNSSNDIQNKPRRSASFDDQLINAGSSSTQSQDAKKAKKGWMSTVFGIFSRGGDPSGLNATTDLARASIVNLPSLLEAYDAANPHAGQSIIDNRNKKMKKRRRRRKKAEQEGETETETLNLGSMRPMRRIRSNSDGVMFQKSNGNFYHYTQDDDDEELLSGDDDIESGDSDDLNDPDSKFEIPRYVEGIEGRSLSDSTMDNVMPPQSRATLHRSKSADSKGSKYIQKTREHSESVVWQKEVFTQESNKMKEIFAKKTSVDDGMFALSLSGHLIDANIARTPGASIDVNALTPGQAKQVLSIFSQHMLTFDQFSACPSLAFDPCLLIMVQNNLYTAALGVPLLLAHMAFGGASNKVSSSKDNISNVSNANPTAPPARGTSWRQWLTGRSNEGSTATSSNSSTPLAGPNLPTAEEIVFLASSETQVQDQGNNNNDEWKAVVGRKKKSRKKTSTDVEDADLDQNNVENNKDDSIDQDRQIVKTRESPPHAPPPPPQPSTPPPKGSKQVQPPAEKFVSDNLFNSLPSVSRTNTEENLPTKEKAISTSDGIVTPPKRSSERNTATPSSILNSMRSSRIANSPVNSPFILPNSSTVSSSYVRPPTEIPPTVSAPKPGSRTASPRSNHSPKITGPKTSPSFDPQQQVPLSNNPIPTFGATQIKTDAGAYRTSPNIRSPNIYHKSPAAHTNEATAGLDATVDGVKFIKSLKPSQEVLQSFNLKYGENEITFSVTSRLQGIQTITAFIYKWHPDDKIVISDVDGTITKSDVLGMLMPLMGKEWSHGGVVSLFAQIKKNGYHMLYLTARSIGQANITREYLHDLQQGNVRMPRGPLMMSPDRLMTSFKKEVIYRKPQEFKITCLKAVRQAFYNNSHLMNVNSLDLRDGIGKSAGDSAREAMRKMSSASEMSTSSKDAKDGAQPTYANDGFDNYVEDVHAYNPFYAAFGNRHTDVVAYQAVGVPESRTFIINTHGEIAHHSNLTYNVSYHELAQMVDNMFPPRPMVHFEATPKVTTMYDTDASENKDNIIESTDNSLASSVVSFTAGNGLEKDVHSSTGSLLLQKTDSISSIDSLQTLQNDKSGNTFVDIGSINSTSSSMQQGSLHMSDSSMNQTLNTTYSESDMLKNIVNLNKPSSYVFTPPAASSLSQDYHKRLRQRMVTEDKYNCALFWKDQLAVDSDLEDLEETEKEKKSKK